MKTWEITKALEEGKKVRKTYWKEGLFIYKDVEGNYLTEDGYVIGDSIKATEDDEWEIIGE